VSNNDELTIRKATLLPCAADLRRKSWKASWKWRRGYCFGKEVQYKVQDITGVVTPND
jgi:hypothetical protein